ncbi:MAG: hypothetical protein LBD20_00825 [Spirochaetaceae bacterium]|nr:hypothetical protein [Spirochaetaceae bacterium]
MQQIKKAAVFFAAALITGVFFFTACNSGVSDSAPTENPAHKRKASKLLVTNRVDLVQKWSEHPANPELGGWYEKSDAPAFDTSVAYDAIDPKKTIAVRKFFENDETMEDAEPGEYTVVVLDAEDKPLTTTKLEKLGIAKIQIIYTADNSVPVSYVDADGKPLGSGKKYFEVMVAEVSPPSKEEFAGFTVQKLPAKTTYDWKEPFDPTGLEVVKWYGSTTVEGNGIPVIANEQDYTLDYSAYAEITKTMDDGSDPVPRESYPEFDVTVQPRAATGSNDAGKTAVFKIKLEFKNYTVTAVGTGGQNLSGGVISFGGASKYKVKNIVHLTFTKTTNTMLNPESVSVRFAGQEVKPLRKGMGAKNQLNFFWDESSLNVDGTINVESETLKANFEMPAADVTVAADFIFSSTRLSNLEIKKQQADNWEKITGFSPNINRYEHVMLNSQNELFIRTDSQADKINFTITPETESQVLEDGKSLHIKKVHDGDTIVAIAASVNNGSAENVTYIAIKRFNNDNRITYGYTGGVQTFKPPVRGSYKFTAWGAYGGNAVDYHSKYGGNGRGGTGARAEGVLEMDPAAPAWDTSNIKTTDTTKLVYVYVGEGGYSREGFKAGKATYNGGGTGGMGGVYGAGSSGGGATSISLSRGAWSDWQVLIDRILVAGGGGGYGHNNGRTGAAGGLVAQGGRVQSNDNLIVGDANPVTGYSGTIVQNGYWNGAGQRAGSGRGRQGFGIGGIGPNPPGYGGSGAEGRGGGGGGYFGGEVSWGKVGKDSNAGGGGGSSYASGHPGVISYRDKSSLSWLVPVGSNVPQDAIDYSAAEIHYSGRVFTRTSMTVIPESGLWQNNQGEDSPAADPFNGGLGELGQKNRDGLLIIEYVPNNP